VYLCVMLVYFCLIFSEFLVVLNACVVYGFSFFSDDFIIILDFSFFLFLRYVYHLYDVYKI